MPNFQENTGFKMPGVGSKEIDSPGNFRDEHHVDKVGYCDTTEDSMLPQGSSPLKARYTSSGYLKDLDAITIPRAAKKKCPEGSVEKDGKCVPVGDTTPTPTPTPTSNKNGFVFVTKEKIDPIESPKDISLSGKKPGKEKYSGESAKSKLDRNLTSEEKAWEKAEVEKYGRDGYREKYKIGKKTTTPGSSSSISSNPK